MAFQRAVGDKMRVGVLDLKTGQIVWPETQGNACHPFFAPDGSLVYAYANITNTAYQRFMLNGPQDGYGIRRWKEGVATDLTHGLWRDYQPSVSPDGKSLYFCTQRPHDGAPPIRIDVLRVSGCGLSSAGAPVEGCGLRRACGAVESGELSTLNPQLSSFRQGNRMATRLWGSPSFRRTDG